MSLPRRIGYAAAGLAGLAGAALIGMLWATEPAPLPVRTRFAFAVLMAIGLAWAGFAAWALTRRPMFAVDRLIAAWLAVAFTTLTTIGTVAVAFARGSVGAALAAMFTGIVLTSLSTIILVRARAYRAALLARREELL
jgi:hypothetical protein